MKNEQFLSINLTHKMGKNESNYFKVKILIPDKLNEYNIFPHIWFSLKSDKCCEQGGFLGWNNNGWSTTTKNLVKPYKNTSYDVIVLGNWSDAASSSCTITAKKVNSFTCINAINNTTQRGVWRAIGFVN